MFIAFLLVCHIASGECELFRSQQTFETREACLQVAQPEVDRLTLRLPPGLRLELECRPEERGA